MYWNSRAPVARLAKLPIHSSSRRQSGHCRTTVPRGLVKTKGIELRHRDDLVVSYYFNGAIAILHGGDIDGEAGADAGLRAAGRGRLAGAGAIAGTRAGNGEARDHA